MDAPLEIHLPAYELLVLYKEIFKPQKRSAYILVSREHHNSLQPAAHNLPGPMCIEHGSGMGSGYAWPTYELFVCMTQPELQSMHWLMGRDGEKHLSKHGLVVFLSVTWFYSSP